MAIDAGRAIVGDYVTLVRGTTYKGQLVGEPGPALLGLGSIEPGGGFRVGNYKTYGGECPEELMLFPGDIYASLKGATKDGKMIGSAARVPPSVPTGRLTQDTVKLVFRTPDPQDATYLYWVLRTPQYRDYCAGHAMGSAVVALSRRDFLSYPVPPPSAERRQVVVLLDAIEEKIELNRKMSETLEAMARALFKSWFVDFDPVRAKMEGRDPGLPKEIADLFPSRMVESELGEIPEGWGVAAIGEHMANFDSRRVPVSGAERAKRPGPYPYHGAAGVMDHVDEYLFDGIHLLVGEDGSVVQNTGMAVTQYVWGKIWVNNHAHVLQGAGAVSTEQLYLYFHFEPVAPYVTGAVQPKLSQGRMNVMPFVYGGDAVCRAFGRTVKPWFERLRAAADEVRTLSELRDALLPKLISGELRLKDAEKIAERAA